MKKIFLNLFLNVAFLLMSCKNEPKIYVLSDNWIVKKIILPTSNLMISDSTKTINPLLKKTKIFTQIDGSCPLCVDKLKGWKIFMKTIDTSKVGFVFLINSEDSLFTFKELNREYIKLSYPYFHDIKRAISSQNKLDYEFATTFLLNDENEVILDGDPTKNKKTLNQYNLEINKIIRKKKPTIDIEEGTNVTKFKISDGFIYKDQNGKTVSNIERDRMMSDNNYIPNIDTDSGIITFQKR